MTTPIDRLVQRQQAALDGPERLIVGQVQQALAETFGSLEIDLRVVLAAIDEARGAGTPVDPAWLQREPRYRRFQTRLREVRQAFVERVLAVMVQGRRLFGLRGRLDVLAQLTALGIAIPPSGPVGGTSTTSERSLRSLIDGLAQLNARVVEDQLGVQPDGSVPPPRPPRSPLLQMLGDPATDARTRTLIRTDLMRIYRAAARERHVAAGDVLQGVQWIASLSSRTCLACLGRHGQVFPVGYVMDAHPSCRCSLAPLAVGTPSAVPETGEEWFRKQPEGVQRQRMGAAYEPFRDGRVGLSDFVGIREHPQWGRSIQQRSQRDVVALSRLGRDGRVVIGRDPLNRTIDRMVGGTTELATDERSAPVVLEQIRRFRREHAYLFRPDGSQAFAGRGRVRTFRVPETWLVRDPVDPSRYLIQDHLLVHNHPKSFRRSTYPPSPDDFFFISEFNLRELLISSGRYDYRLSRPDGGWAEREQNEVRRRYEAARILAERLRGGPYSAADLRRGEDVHDVFAQLAREGWIDYVRILREESGR